MSRILLKLEHIRHTYGKQVVINDLSLTLKEGDIGCLLGPSGCGKTTVLRCIAGFEAISAGEILLNEMRVSSAASFLSPEQRHMGMVFQDYALFPHLTVVENIGFGLHRMLKAEREQRIAELLKIVGLVDVPSKYPHELSGGQQQRVALARALAPRPDLLLLDEPFSNLDVSLRERLSLEVRDILKNQGMTAILVTHDQDEAFAIADEIGVMYEGEIQQWDTAYNLYHRPANRFVANFIGQGIFVPGKIIDLQQVEIELGVLKGEISHQPVSDCDVYKKGGIVDVLLRPDDIVHDDTSPLQASVVHKAFRGADILYTLRLADGDIVLSLVPSHHNHAIGEKIGIKLEADHVVVFNRFES
ncbi:iron(III) transport system ATP-binding protein [Nitrosomonas cryotolerans]|uniref:Iron(III) transport system ATP-binding protein n=1 Tax=Nitrosomonas cryotolerans ATCC 49181 TaxID=1131553 RepID=A0A1N6JCX3_9PROT|nr:ABC transporter ATP-binding protein [Nitrosomonas cryotolerans]SFP48846.1 iron(III) transport system ATP-binding protein [Nitrosomonas cryotolerans]SIO41989.1 iron(III) transport system ATP-binding protein [Nitrosomonas cryotolerans ATCC 49181]